MGGKNAIIVDDDADLDEAIAAVLASAFGYQGQKCSACSRVVTVGADCERLVERLIEATASLVIGPPERPDVALGPVISAAQRDRIEGAIAAGRTQGAVRLRRSVSGLNGYYVGPAIFDHVPADAPLVQEEIFGPVLAIQRAADLDEAFRLANGTRYALTGGFFSRSPSAIERAMREFEVGNLYINRKITGALVGRQPFGGFRMSGLGAKAGGPDYLLQFLDARTMTENTLRKGFAPR